MEELSNFIKRPNKEKRCKPKGFTMFSIKE
jgi:hypothetical protein